MQIPVEKLFQNDAKFAMTPMIDMVFLLLVFFMCASHMSVVQSIPLKIPVAEKAVVPKTRAERFIVNITKDGATYCGNQKVTIEQLKTQVKQAKAADPAVKLYLRADQETPHRYVKKVMNAVGDVGINDFVFGVFIPDK